MSLVFLIGMPGSGKTYWAKRIAKEHKFNFIDLDNFIEKNQKRTVKEIFSLSGEAAFRQIENYCLTKLIQESTNDTVVACGGGTPCYLNNLEILKQSGAVIYLKSTIENLICILSKSYVRPILGNYITQEVIEELLQKRENYYNQAHFILETKDLTVNHFATIIQSCIKNPLQ